MAVTYTTNYNLSKYDAGDTGWDTGINGNFDTIDATLHDLQTQINDITDTLDPTYLRLDGTNSPTANIDLANKRVTNAGDPVDPQDYTTKSYVDYFVSLDAPILSGTDHVYENNSATNTIDNYNTDYTYTLSFSDPLLTGSIDSSGVITIDAGDITDGVNHNVDMTVTVSAPRRISASTTKTIEVRYISLVSDDAVLLEGTTYIASNIDYMYNGELI